MAYTRLFQTGFEFNDVDELDSITGFGAGSSTIGGSSFANTGSYCLKLNTACPPRGKACSSSTLTSQCGMYMRHAGTGTNDEGIIFLIRGDIDISATYDSADNKVRIRVNGTEEDFNTPANLGISTANEYHHYGLYVFRDSTNGRVAFYIDGSLALSFDGNTGTYTNGVYAGGELTLVAWSANAYIDDFYCRISTIEESETPPPSYQYPIIRPNANGSTNDWSFFGGASNYESVDDTTPDDDTTYVYSTTVDDVDQFSLVDYSVPSGFSLNAVIPTVLARKTGASTDPTLIIGLNENATDAFGTEKTLSTVYEYYFEAFSTAPDSDTWDDTNIDATIAQIKSAGTF